MKVHTESFHTESEAIAFIGGVELASDSPLEVCGLRQREGSEEGEENAWTVAVHDGSVRMADDVCPLCGAREPCE